jgi:hypothetical protein
MGETRTGMPSSDGELIGKYSLGAIVRMSLDLFSPLVNAKRLHPNFVHVAGEKDDAVRAVLRDWSDGFVDRDGKLVIEFQTTFNSAWWELYIHAVLKSLGVRVDFGFDAPDFVATDAGFVMEATIASHAAEATPEWQKTIEDVTRTDAIAGRYVEALARLSNSLDGKVRRYRERYAALPHVNGKAYVIAIHNFGTPDAHQLGDVAMQRLLYDVWGEGAFLKDGRIPLPTGLFLDDKLKEVSAVMYSSLATFGKARALSNSKGDFVFQAIRIRNNIKSICIDAKKEDYRESLRDGLRIFHNPYASHQLNDNIFNVEDIRRFRIRNGEIEATCHPAGDLCMRQVNHIVTRDTL